jgi:hypothetical protein
MSNKNLDHKLQTATNGKNHEVLDSSASATTINNNNKSATAALFYFAKQWKGSNTKKT